MAHRIEGSWQSYVLKRPNDNKTDLKPAGTISITRIDPITGEVSGMFKTEEGQDEVAIRGRVTFVGSNAYALVIEHDISGVDGFSRHYEGILVAESTDDANRTIRVVVGRYRNTDMGGLVEPDGVAAADGQEQGTWVGTQP